MIAVGLVFSIPAMTHPIKLVPVLNAHLMVPPLPTSRRAHHLLPITVSAFSLLDLAAAVQALFTPMHALAGCVTVASLPIAAVAAPPFPKCLIPAHLGICGLPGYGCACELGALVGFKVVIAPVIQLEAVALAIIYFAGSCTVETLSSTTILARS